MEWSEVGPITQEEVAQICNLLQAAAAAPFDQEAEPPEGAIVCGRGRHWLLIWGSFEVMTVRIGRKIYGLACALELGLLPGNPP